MPERPAPDAELLRRSLVVTRQDVEALRRAGYSEPDIARIVADAAAHAAKLARDDQRQQGGDR